MENLSPRHRTPQQNRFACVEDALLCSCTYTIREYNTINVVVVRDLMSSDDQSWGLLARQGQMKIFRLEVETNIQQ